jgi:glycosyltransferase involved in cell wall biosynthesis
LVPSGQPQALALAVINLLDNPQQASVMRLAAAERVKAEFSIDQTIAQTQAIYEELLAVK